MTSNENKVDLMVCQYDVKEIRYLKISTRNSFEEGQSSFLDVVLMRENSTLGHVMFLYVHSKYSRLQVLLHMR